MAEASIPVDLLNPGQVFASLGFLEAADVLCGDAEGGFDWSNEGHVRFVLRAGGEENPFGVVLGFLAEAEIQRRVPNGYEDPVKKGGGALLSWSETFPSREVKADRLPLTLVSGARSIELGHWTDGSSRNDFKLYVGNEYRSADRIALAMAKGANGNLGVCALWSELRNEMLTKPLDVPTPVGGSFNFDPRGAWAAIDAGYSPDEQMHIVKASPTLELLAALGLEHARPDEHEGRVRYGIWGGVLPPMLARAALGCVNVGIPMRMFRFVLRHSGKNKIVTFAQEEDTS